MKEYTLETFKKYKRLIILFFIYIFVISSFGYLYKYYNITQDDLKTFVNSFGAFGFIILGMIYSQGLSGIVAASIFALYDGSTPHIWIAILGGLGTAFADLLMYEFFKFKIHSELTALKTSRLAIYLSKYKIFKDKLIMTLIGFIIIASPLPDDMGIILIEEENILKTKYFFIIDAILNSLGILFFLSL